MNDYTYGPHMPERRTNPVLFVLVPLMVIGAPIILAVLLKTGGNSGGAPPASAVGHPAGAAVADGSFIFHVTGVKIRERIKSDAAKGVYVLVSLDVTSRDGKPRNVFADDQELLASGKAYDVDRSATVHSDKGPEVGLPEKINPGATERIVVVYDVPRDATPQAIELHGAPGSVGALVALPPS